MGSTVEGRHIDIFGDISDKVEGRKSPSKHGHRPQKTKKGMKKKYKPQHGLARLEAFGSTRAPVGDATLLFGHPRINVYVYIHVRILIIERKRKEAHKTYFKWDRVGDVRL